MLKRREFMRIAGLTPLTLAATASEPKIASADPKPAVTDRRPKPVPLQPQSASNAEKTPWTHLDFNNRPENFNFAIVSDFSGNIHPDLVKVAFEKINLLRPEFVMSVGDLIEGCGAHKDFTRQQFEELDQWVSVLKMPFFYVPGNHDTGNKEMLEVWRERYGKDYYHFVYQDVLFLCLNSNEIAFGRLSPQQLDWTANVLAENAGVRWTLVFIHDPMWEYDWADYGSKADWDRIEDLLKDRPYTVFVGHYHNYAKFRRNNRNYYILSRTGLPGPLSPDLMKPVNPDYNQIAWVSMTDEGPIVANLPLLAVLDDEFYDKEEEQKRLKEHHEKMRIHAEGTHKRYAGPQVQERPFDV